MDNAASQIPRCASAPPTQLENQVRNDLIKKSSSRPVINQIFFFSIR